MIIDITIDMLRDGLSSNGGYNKNQLLALGVPWPPDKGWQREITRHGVDETAYKRFLELKLQRGKVTKKRKKKAKREHKKSLIESDAFLSSYEWRKLRYSALNKCGKKCQCCGRSPKDGITLHVDHIKPRKHYPHLALSLANLQVLCHECNHGKGNWDETDHRI